MDGHLGCVHHYILMITGCPDLLSQISAQNFMIDRLTSISMNSSIPFMITSQTFVRCLMHVSQSLV